MVTTGGQAGGWGGDHGKETAETAGARWGSELSAEHSFSHQTKRYRVHGRGEPHGQALRQLPAAAAPIQDSGQPISNSR